MEIEYDQYEVELPDSVEEQKKKDKAARRSRAKGITLQHTAIIEFATEDPKVEEGGGGIPTRISNRKKRRKIYTIDEEHG